MPLYTTFEDVRLRVVGKVRFTESDDPRGADEGKMPKKLALRLIDEAEGQVEQDLSPRYAAPFTNTTGAAFNTIPLRPTGNIIKTLCELKSVIRILETDFGSGTAVDAQKYVMMLQKRYNDIVNNNILAKFGTDYAATRQWKFPPLPNLKKAYHNTTADDGYAGLGPMVTSDRGHLMDQIQDRLDSPAEDFFNVNWRTDE